MTKHPSRQQRQSISNRLKELKHLEPHPGANAPEATTFTDAEAFAEQLPEPLRRMPHISLAHDGELNFAWNGGPIYIDLGFYGTGTYSYFARDAQGRKYHGDHLPARGPLPESLRQMLAG